MTITVLPTRNEYTANAGQDVFAYTFKIFQDTDINVYVTPAGQDCNDTNDLVIPTSVTDVGNEDGGTITIPTPANAGDLVTIVSDIPANRTTNYQNNGDFRPDTVNDDFDRVVSLVKQVEDLSNRTVLLPECQQGPKPLSLQAPEAGLLVRWNSTESGLENIDVSSLSPGITTNDRVLFNFATLTEAVASTDTDVIKNGAPIVVKERTGGNLGGGIWDIVLTTTVTPNGFNIVQSTGLPTLSFVLRQSTRVFIPAQYGLIYNDSTGTVPTENFDTLEFISTLLVDGDKVEFSGDTVYLAHSRGYLGSPTNGFPAFPLQSINNLTFSGNGTTIKVINHDLSINNGLSFISFDAVKNLDVHGFVSEMSYINRNTSSTFYPFIGFMWGQDSLGTAGSRTVDQLSRDIKCHDNVFDNFHPEGAFGESGSPFMGDPNNGFKNYSFTALGDDQAVTRDVQNENCSAYRNTFRQTHNGYGCWIWAYNNAAFYDNKAAQWNTWASDSAGVDKGSRIPFIRYHQFYCSGVNVFENQMTARDEADRTGAYQGAAFFCDLTNNLVANLQRGESSANNNTISLRTNDRGVFSNVYGTVNINDNVINGVNLDDRPIAAIDINATGQGKGFLNITNNSLDENFSAPLIRIENVADTAAERRYKTINVQSNLILGSQGAGVIFTNNTGGTVVGCEKFYMSDNVYDASNSQFSPANTNGAMVNGQLCNEATDIYKINDNVVIDIFNIENIAVGTVHSEGNEGSGVTSSTTFNYLRIRSQTRAPKEVVNPDIPRVGVANTDLFSYSAWRIVNSTGVVQQFVAGIAPGGSSLAGATPVGETWYIDETLVAKRGL